MSINALSSHNEISAPRAKSNHYVIKSALIADADSVDIQTIVYYLIPREFHLLIYGFPYAHERPFSIWKEIEFPLC